MKSNPLFTTDAFLWGLGAICQLHRIPFAPNLLLQQIAPPYSLVSLQQAAQSLKLKSGVRSVASSELHTFPQPFLAIFKPGARGASTATPTNTEPAPSGPIPNRLAVVLK